MSLDIPVPIKTDGNLEAKSQLEGEGHNPNLALTPELSIGLHIHLHSGDAMDRIEGPEALGSLESPYGLAQAQLAHQVSSPNDSSSAPDGNSWLPFDKAREDLHASSIPC